MLNLFLNLFGMSVKAPETFVFKGIQYTNWRGGRYATGEPRTAMRGLVHILALLIICPIHAYQMFYVASNMMQKYCSSVFILCLSMLYLISSQFHIRTVPLYIDAFMRRWDHCNIFMLGYAFDIPLGILLLNSEFIYAGIFFITATCLVVSLGCMHSITTKLDERIDTFATVLYIATGGMLFLFVPYLYVVMTTFEFNLMIFSRLLAGIGIFIYKTHCLDFIPDIWGYHESFHLITTIVNTLSGIYLTSIIKGWVSHPL